MCPQKVLQVPWVSFLSLPAGACPAADFVYTACYPFILFLPPQLGAELRAWAMGHQGGRRGGSSEDGVLGKRQDRNIKTKKDVQNAGVVVPGPRMQGCTGQAGWAVRCTQADSLLQWLGFHIFFMYASCTWRTGCWAGMMCPDVWVRGVLAMAGVCDGTSDGVAATRSEGGLLF
jgi:hypothetical protein